MTVKSIFEESVSPSLFEGINARYYRASEVTRSFVPNEQFDNLVVRQHSLVVGPRGSGKTTLLRMLHPECISVWQHPRADEYRQLLDFTGIYLATDRVWREQLAAAAVGVSEATRDDFFNTVVAIDAMAAMVRSLELRLQGDDSRFRPVHLTAKETARLVAELAAGWMLEPQFWDLGSLRVALRRRRIQARQWVQAKRDGRGEPRPPWVGIPWDDALLLGVDAFESITNRPGELWALLLDEAEIAPPVIRDSILGSTRGLDPRMLIKCSLSPWLQESPLPFTEHDGTVFNDFNVLRLFYGRRDEGYSFSRDIIRARLAAAGRSIPEGMVVEDAVFGKSQFVVDIDGRTSRTAPAYGDDSALGQVVKDLAASDPNFRKWLKQNDIDSSDLDAVPGKKRASTLRKARNIMVARLEFRRMSGQLRSRKTIAMYAGGTTMLDICEGNPRLLLGLLLPLLEYYDGVHPIPAALQGEALDEIADDFYALIDAIPVPDEIRSPPELGRRRLRRPYREVIDRIARFFQGEILRGEFNPQPPTTIRVPQSTSSEMQRILGRLINVGAIVLIPDRGVKDIVLGGFDQQRVRLCYLAAAREHLPPNLDRPVSIRTVFRRGHAGGNEGQIPGLEDEA